MIKGEDDLVYRRLRNRLSALDQDLIDPLPLIPTPTGATGPGDVRWQYYIDNLIPYIYHLECHKTDGSTYGGTAFAFSPKFLATAAHLLDGHVFICPPFPDGEEVSDAVLHHLAPKGADVALVSLPSALVPVRSPLHIRPDPLAIGEPVAALGFGATPQRQPAVSFSTGIVESRTPVYTGEVETVVVSINIAGGMSGAPVIDSGGSLVGVVAEVTYEQTADGVPARAYNHIVPVTYLLELERTLRSTTTGLL